MLNFVSRLLQSSPQIKRSHRYFKRCVHSNVVPPDDNRQPVDNPQSLDKHVGVYSFPEQSIRINSGGEVYDAWRKEKRFQRMPDGDLTFNIRYIDTKYADFTGKNHVNEDSPVVVALHGAPGSYTDFKLLTSSLWERGVRVVSPKLPDFTDYPPAVYRNSVEERISLLTAFLQALDIDCVNMLVCHSSATYPGLELCMRNAKPYILSLGLLNPMSYLTKTKSTNFFFIKNMVRLSEIPFVYEWMKTANPGIFKYFTPVRVDSFMDPLLSCTVMNYANIPMSRHNLNELSKRQFPVFMAFSEDDKMIQKDLSYKVAYKFRMKDESIAFVTRDGNMLNQGETVNNVRAIAFEKGSHYVFSKYPEIINSELYSFLEKHAL